MRLVTTGLALILASSSPALTAPTPQFVTLPQGVPVQQVFVNPQPSLGLGVGGILSSVAGLIGGIGSGIGLVGSGVSGLLSRVGAGLGLGLGASGLALNRPPTTILGSPLSSAANLQLPIGNLATAGVPLGPLTLPPQSVTPLQSSVFGAPFGTGLSPL